MKLSPPGLTSVPSEFARGWGVLLAATVGVGLGTTGLPFYAFGQFVRPISDSFGWSRAAVSGAIMGLMIGTVITSPLVGRIVDRFGIRPVALTSQLGLALGFLGVSYVGNALVWFYVAWLALSCLGSGTSPIVWTRAVAGQFERRRGLALGIMLCGTGLVAIGAPLVINQIVGGFGWRMGFRAMAGVVVLIGLPATFVLLRERPQAGSAPAVTHGGTTLHQALHTGIFWRLLLAFFLISVAIAGVIVHLPAMLADRGFEPSAAARSVAVLGYAIIIGRLSLGALVDRFSAAAVGAGLIALGAAGCLVLAIGGPPIVAIVLLGLSAGAEVDLLAFLVSRLFGLRHYAHIYGWGISAFTAGAGIGPFLIGAGHDHFGSYTPALYGFAVITLAAAALVGSLGMPPRLSPGHLAARTPA